MKKKNLLIISIILLALSACSRGEETSPTESPDATIATSVATSVESTFEAKDDENATAIFATSEAIIETSVASTLQTNDSIIATSVAETVEAMEEIVPTIASTATLAPSETPTPSTSETPTTDATSEAPTGSLTPTATVSSSTTTVRVSVDTNCRTGPDKDYQRVGILKVGETAKVVGKKVSYNYWIIENPSADGECWLWGKYATVEGDTSTLDEYPLPSSPTSTTTPSATTVIASVSVDTNCRTGPDKDYEQVGILKVGESAKVLGKKTSYNYWIIENPSADGECWLWGKYATVDGDISTLEEYALPPLP